MPLPLLSSYRLSISAHYRPDTLILYSSTRGTAKSLSFSLLSALVSESFHATAVESISSFEPDDLLSYRSIVLILSTQTGGTPAEDAQDFHTLLHELATDHRVSADHFRSISFGVVGLGSDAYAQSHYCTPAKEVDRWFAKLGARRLFPLLMVTDTSEYLPQKDRVIKQVTKGLGLFRAVKTTPISTPIIEDEEETNDIEEDDTCATTLTTTSTTLTTTPGFAGSGGTPKPKMITTKQEKQLTKEGYKIIGSHSAVKLCRWTKHHLRGRGGCYKHTFYGIESGQCMEMTPSLACANKCVFCWRHHKNPVATEWKFDTDAAEYIVREAIDIHLKMIKELRGVPDVKTDRFDQASKVVKHCALSLVGEPIMYPEINTLIYELHKRGISTFLVNNGQWPEAVRALAPVTQLYVSVDAATPESLKAVDRPLFEDYWERFIDSLSALKHKRQRTVYRLTLVKDYNMDEIGKYRELVKLGKPSFIEVKGVTYNGEESGMSMSNVPWFEEVAKFCEALCVGDEMGEYELCCEHKHSLSVLIADKKFKVDGKWMTWIDYEKFGELVMGGGDFGAEDYWAETPEWALYGAEEAGFDPSDTRVFKRHR